MSRRGTHRDPSRERNIPAANVPPVSTQVIALAAELAALPGVREAVRAVEEPSALLVIAIGFAGLAVGRSIAVGKAGGRD
ncbi:hypothetical protein MTsN3n11_09580 [Qipengyuania sp. MTN3-11]